MTRIYFKKHSVSCNIEYYIPFSEELEETRIPEFKPFIIAIRNGKWNPYLNIHVPEIGYKVTCEFVWFLKVNSNNIPPFIELPPMYRKCENGNTYAMMYTMLGIKNIPRVLLHDSDIQNIYGDTVAMIMIRNNRDMTQIPEEWIHDPDIMNGQHYTCAMLWCKFNRQLPPKNLYQTNLLIQDNENQRTLDMWIRTLGIIPPPELVPHEKVKDPIPRYILPCYSTLRL